MKITSQDLNKGELIVRLLSQEAQRAYLENEAIKVAAKSDYSVFVSWDYGNTWEQVDNMDNMDKLDTWLKAYAEEE